MFGAAATADTSDPAAETTDSAEDSSSDTSEASETTVTADTAPTHDERVAAWHELAQDLDQGAQRFLTNVSRRLWANGNRVYAIRNTGAIYELVSVHLAHQSLVEYTFDVGVDDTSFSVQTSEDYVVDVDSKKNPVTYTMYDANDPGTVLGTVDLPKPPNFDFYDYAVDGDWVYFIEEPSVRRWKPGMALETVAEVPNLDIGTYLGGRVADGVFIYRVNYALFGMVLETGETFSLGTQGFVENFEIERGKVLFSDSRRLGVFDIATRTTRDLNGEFEVLGYQVLPGETQSHIPSGMEHGTFDMLDDDTVVYTGQEGIFSFGLTTHEFRPILLNDWDDTLEHAWDVPAVTTSGHLFAVRAEDDDSPGLDVSPDVYVVAPKK